MNQNLPAGAWLHLAPLPLDYTEEQLSDLLYQHGIDCPPERCSVLPGSKYASALVSIPTETTADLVRWALDNAALVGTPITVEKSRSVASRSKCTADGRVTRN